MEDKPDGGPPRRPVLKRQKDSTNMMDSDEHAPPVPPPPEETSDEEDADFFVNPSGSVLRPSENPYDKQRRIREANRALSEIPMPSTTPEAKVRFSEVPTMLEIIEESFTDSETMSGNDDPPAEEERRNRPKDDQGMTELSEPAKHLVVTLFPDPHTSEDLQSEESENEEECPGDDDYGQAETAREIEGTEEGGQADEEEEMEDEENNAQSDNGGDEEEDTVQERWSVEDPEVVDDLSDDFERAVKLGPEPELQSEPESEHEHEPESEHEHEPESEHEHEPESEHEHEPESEHEHEPESEHEHEPESEHEPEHGTHQEQQTPLAQSLDESGISASESEPEETFTIESAKSEPEEEEEEEEEEEGRQPQFRERPFKNLSVSFLESPEPKTRESRPKSCFDKREPPLWKEEKWRAKRPWTAAPATTRLQHRSSCSSCSSWKPEMLPHYNGLRSEYGLTAEQLQERKRIKMERAKVVRDRRLERWAEDERRRHENNLMFSSWLARKRKEANEKLMACTKLANHFKFRTELAPTSHLEKTGALRKTALKKHQNFNTIQDYFNRAKPKEQKTYRIYLGLSVE